MKNDQIEVSVLVDGKPLRQILHENRLFIQANKGAEYEVKVKNNTAGRILASFSIDGTCPLSGEPTGKDAGYVINAHDSFTLKGFRVSDEKVNAFRFNDVEKSYAVKNPDTKDASNVGCIGVRVFKELVAKPNLEEFWKQLYEAEKNKPKTWPTYPTRPWYHEDDIYRPHKPYPYPIVTWVSTTVTDISPEEFGMQMRCMNNSMNSALGAGLSCSANSLEVSAQNCSFSTSPFNAGTEFSDKVIIDKVKEVSFEKDALIGEYEIFYSWKEDLIRMGVPIIKETKVNFPSAFPKKYCQKPE